MKTKVETNPKKLREQAKGLGIDTKGVKIPDLKKLVAAKLNEADDLSESDETIAPKKKGGGKKPAAKKKGGGKKASPKPEEPAQSVDTDAIVEQAKKAALEAMAPKVKKLEKRIDALEAMLADDDEPEDEPEEEPDDEGDEPEEDETDDGDEGGPKPVSESNAKVLSDYVDEEGYLVLDPDDVDSLNQKQLNAVESHLSGTFDFGDAKGIRAKRDALKSFIIARMEAALADSDPIEGPDGQQAQPCAASSLDAGDDVYIVDTEGTWYRGTIQPSEDPEEDPIFGTDEDGDPYIMVECEDGETALVYFLQDGQADPEFVGQALD